jgi:hypothetical protein
MALYPSPLISYSSCGALLWPDVDSFLIVVSMGISDNALKILVNLMTKFRSVMFWLVGEINIFVRISIRDDL